jgi:hypothetical protein
MGNLDFAHHAGFSWYCVFLMASGIVLLLVAVLKNQTTQRRIVRALFGIGFFGYGFYLTFIFGGGSYFVFFYAFLVPLWLIVDTFRARGAASQRARQPVPAGMTGMAGPGTPPVADLGLQPMTDPGLPPVADPGLPPTPPS